jgi:hypothetical protein
MASRMVLGTGFLPQPLLARTLSDPGPRLFDGPNGRVVHFEFRRGYAA